MYRSTIQSCIRHCTRAQVQLAKYMPYRFRQLILQCNIIYFIFVFLFIISLITCTLYTVFSTTVSYHGTTIHTSYIPTRTQYTLQRSADSYLNQLFYSQDVVDNSFTIEGEIYFNKLPHNDCTYELTILSSNILKYSVICGNTIRLTVQNDITKKWIDYDSSAQVLTNRWYHIAVTYDQSIPAVAFFINGRRSVATQLSNIDAIDDTQQLIVPIFNYPIALQRYPADSSYVDYNLHINSIRVWNMALTTPQIIAQAVDAQVHDTYTGNTHLITHIQIDELPHGIPPLDRTLITDSNQRHVITDTGTNKQSYSGALDQYWHTAPLNNDYSIAAELQSYDTIDWSLGLFPRRYLQSTGITHYIHQTNAFEPNEDEHPELYKLVKTWKHQNLQYNYTFWSDEQIDRFVHQHYPNFYTFFTSLPRPVLKADLFRYMVVYQYGGVYADTDTQCIRPIDYWTQPHERKIWIKELKKFVSQHEYTIIMTERRTQAGTALHRTSNTDYRLQIGLPPINIIIGVEADFTEWPGKFREYTYAREQQMCQWTFAGAAGHPLLRHVVYRTLEQLQSRTPIELLDLNVLEATGPGIFTDGIRDYLIRTEGLTDGASLMGYVTPLQVGDVYILPVNGFGYSDEFPVAGALKSDLAGKSPRCVQHRFLGSWRKNSATISLEHDGIRKAQMDRLRGHEPDSDYTVEEIGMQQKKQIDLEWKAKQAEILWKKLAERTTAATKKQQGNT